MINAIEEAAEAEIPIFNIGLDGWFSIFGPENWKDEDLRLKLMNALARLNQTPDTTLDPNHANFRGLVKGNYAICLIGHITIRTHIYNFIHSLFQFLFGSILSAGIRKRIEPPKFSIVGLFGVTVIRSDPPEKHFKYSDLEDETIQVIALSHPAIFINSLSISCFVYKFLFDL